MKLTMNNQIKINLPKNSKLIIWLDKKNNKNIWIFNNNKNLKIVPYKINFSFDKWSNSLWFNLNEYCDNCLKIENCLNSFLKSWNLFFFQKIKFKGKGFRIKFFKKINFIKFYFGKSHKTFLFLKKIKKKKINKYKFILFGLNKELILRNSIIIDSIKKLNFYTLRGLRLSRQIIYKRKGKKGTYI